MENGKNLLFLICFLTGSIQIGLTQEKNPIQLIQQMEQALGGWEKLYALKDVEFTYDYAYPTQGIKDLSTERYIFEGEHSWAKYTTHQINVLKDQDGEVIQCYDGKKASIALNGKQLDQAEAIGGTHFLRKANYFWFVMMFKLDDPGTEHRYIGQETIDGITYDKVGVSYNAAITEKAQNDAYVIFINPATKLVDRFFFSLPAMGVNEPVLLMKVEYEEINGVKLPLKRYVFQPGEDGKPQTEPFLVQTSSNLKFNNGFQADDLSLF